MGLSLVAKTAFFRMFEGKPEAGDAEIIKKNFPLKEKTSFVSGVDLLFYPFANRTGREVCFVDFVIKETAKKISLVGMYVSCVGVDGRSRSKIFLKHGARVPFLFSDKSSVNFVTKEEFSRHCQRFFSSCESMTFLMFDDEEKRKMVFSLLEGELNGLVENVRDVGNLIALCDCKEKIDSLFSNKGGEDISECEENAMRIKRALAICMFDYGFHLFFHESLVDVKVSYQDIKRKYDNGSLLKSSVKYEQCMGYV